MRIGKYPVASVLLIVIFGTRLFLKLFFPAKMIKYDPALDQLLLGAIIVYLIYHASIWISAWLNNRREEIQ